MDKNIKMSTAILDGFDDCIYVMNQDLVIEYCRIWRWYR
jgi:hypothetical protein